MKKKKANQYIKSLNLVPSDATGSLWPSLQEKKQTVLVMSLNSNKEYAG